MSRLRAVILIQMKSRVEKRNNYIISKGFRNYFRTLILSVIVEQVCLTFNMIFVGQFVSAEAFSALDLAIPVESFFTGLFLLLIGGAAAPASRYVGNQEFDKAHKMLTSSMLLATGAAVILALAGILNIDSIVSLLSSDATLSGYLKEYLGVYFIMFITMAVSSSLVQIINIDGKPDIATWATVIAGAVDVLLDVVFLKVLNMGVSGVAWADVASYVLMALIITPYLLSKKSQFRFRLAAKDFAALQKESLSAGVSYCIPNVALCAIVFIVNSLVLGRLGTEALYVWSVGYQVLSIIVMLMSCIGGTVLVTMGSMLVGCGEMKGLRYLAHRCLLVSLLCISLIVAFVIAFPHETLSIFGNSGNPTADEIAWLRMVVVFAVPYGICSLKSYLSQTLERTVMSIVPFALFFTISLLAFSLSAWFDPYWMFASMSAAGLLYLLADAVYSVVKRHMNPGYSRYLLIPSDEGKHSLYMSVPYTGAGLESALSDMASFLQACELSPSLRGGINICCEELAMNLIEKNKDKGDGYYFDIFILEERDAIKVNIKDAGLPFNPVKKYEGTAADAYAAGEDMDLSLRLVNVLCQDLTYNYMFGQNTIYMTFNK